MPQTLDRQLLTKVLSDTLEVAAFQYTTTCAVGILPGHDQALIAELGFWGPADGRVQFIAPLAFARLVAASMLGMAEKEASDQADQAMGELVNMLGGQLLEHWFGCDADYNSGLPTVAQSHNGEAAPSALDPSRSTVVETDDGHLIALQVVLDSPAEQVGHAS